jgi:DNA repair protein RecO (recombination protein O)
MAKVRDQALCLRCTDWSETSQLVTLLTRDQGVVRGLAKGSKRLSPSSIGKFSGGFELLTGGELMASLKTGEGLATLTEWNLQQTFRHMRTDLAAQRLALYAADITQALLAEHDPHPTVFDGLVLFFNSLKKPAQSPDADDIPDEQTLRTRLWSLLIYQALLLHDAGYRPVLDHDAKTGHGLPATGALAFDPAAGGVTMGTGAHETTGLSPAGPWRVRRETLTLLELVFNLQPNTGTGPDSPPALDPLTRANRLLCVYIRAILDRELATMSVILDKQI